MDEAIRLLKELRTKVENESWAHPPMQRAVLAGIRMSIQKLEVKNTVRHEYARCSDPWTCSIHQRNVLHRKAECLSLADCNHHELV